jgi:hypothetical protein
LPDPARAHADLLSFLAASKPPRIAPDPDPDDFIASATHVVQVIAACKDYLFALVRHAEESEQGASIAEADLIGAVDAHLADLAGDIAGRFDAVAERMIDERYGSATRQRHYSRRIPLGWVELRK